MLSERVEGLLNNAGIDPEHADNVLKGKLFDMLQRAVVENLSAGETAREFAKDDDLSRVDLCFLSSLLTLAMAAANSPELMKQVWDA